MRETIKDFYGRQIGFRETQSNNDVIAKDGYGRILGRYDAKMKVTKDAYGKIVANGDTTSALIWQAYYTYQQQINKNKK